MKQLENESLEDYVDRFMFVYKRSTEGLNDDICQKISYEELMMNQNNL